MPNTEDYLDGLLDSITKAKSDSYGSERRERDSRSSRRSRISADDDFMEASGLRRRSSRKGDRRKKSRRRPFDSGFFDDLDGEMTDEDDDFLREFERELDSSDDEDIFDITDINHETNIPVDDIPVEEKSSDSSAKDAILGDIAGIVSEAKQKIEEGNDELLEDINAKMNEPAGKSFTTGVPGGAPTEPPADLSEESLLSPEFAEDELDLADEPDLSAGTQAQEVPLMDESGEGVDLNDMLSADGDESLLDIGELLNSDEEGEELSESREAFEAGAESAAGGGGGVDGDSKGAGAEETDEAVKKPGLLARILSIFKKKDKDEEGSDVGALDPTPEQLAAESAQIIDEFDEDDEDDDEETPEERKARKKKEKEEEKAKKKAEKEAAKKAKEAAKKEAQVKKDAAKAAKAAAKAAKPKKKKKKDTSPPIPIVAFIPFLLLGASVVVGINIVSNVWNYQTGVEDARESFEKEDYITTYGIVAGMELNPEDEKLRDQAKTLAFLQTKYKEYKVCMEIGKYQMALDSLVDGANYYAENKKLAKKLDVEEPYNKYGQAIEKQLNDKFNLSEDEAIEIWKSLTRKEYTTKLQDAVRAAGYKDEY